MFNIIIKISEVGNNIDKQSECKQKIVNNKTNERENQDGGVGRHTTPPCTIRTDRKSNGKDVQHQGNKK